ncbi:MAG: AsmA family protein, partial [Alphaproteobacteria bacterium]|nr:AsmA family protein [Alphaproteobacteria bacterium]
SQGAIPNVPINIERLRAANLDVTLHAEHINDPSLPLQNMDTRFLLKDGDLKVDPLKFGVADGTIGGTVDLDGRQDVPKIATDLTLSRLSLKSFFTGTRFESLSAGRFGGHVKLTGDGKSLAQFLGTSNGHMTISMSGGQISALMINAADLDVAKAVANVLGTDKPTPLRCVVADFDVQRGMMVSKIFDIDTGLSNIYGTANIDFANEGLDIEIEGHPKKPSPLAVTAPITITGTMKNPNFGLKGGPLGARGAVAAALGVLLPPLAILPFIETGVGKDSDCAGLIQEAQAHAAEQAQAPGAPPQDQTSKPVPGTVPPPAPGTAPVINDTSRIPSTTGNPTP